MEKLEKSERIEVRRQCCICFGRKMKKMMVKDESFGFENKEFSGENLEGFRESIEILEERLKRIMELLGESSFEQSIDISGRKGASEEHRESVENVTETWKMSHHEGHMNMERSVQEECLEKAMKMKSNKESRDRDFGTMMSQGNKDDGKQERMSMDQMVRGPLEAYNLMRGESIQGRVNVNKDREKSEENCEVMEDQYPKAVMEDIDYGEVMEDLCPQGDMDRDSESGKDQELRPDGNVVRNEKGLRSDDDSERDGLFDENGYKMSRPVELQSVSSYSKVILFIKGEDKREAGWFGVLDQRGGTLDSFLEMDLVKVDRVMKNKIHNVNTVEDYLMDSEDSCKSEGFTLKILETLATWKKITGKGRLQRKRGSEGTCATVSRTSRKPNGRGQATFWKEMSKNSCVIQRKGENTRLRFLPLRGRVLKWDRKRMKVQRERMEK